ncbi:MAG: hypothetical protein AMS27_12130 [Bacteroides sp. SM23_62_1]|nr:MAG: hypothetical protein AMS27_12130 [Bacteroides sp. SM23_62_1]
MKNSLLFILLFLLYSGSCIQKEKTKEAIWDTIITDTIQYHPVRLDKNGNILPWYSSDQGESYDTVIALVWDFWKNIEIDSNGLRYYMNHQVWRPEHDMRGLGGDQINMALSSWTLLYHYTGDRSVVDNMVYMADEYLQRSLSDSSAAWPFLPFPYNTDVHSGKYDGDMRNGKGFLQPDKAGNFGFELVNLYKITGDQKYLDAAIRIASILASKTRPGDAEKSPLPFRVNAETGEPGLFYSNMDPGKVESSTLYTANWTGTLMLFQEMNRFDPVNANSYQKSFDIILDWMKNYPLKTNKWGPFFEDIPGWSNTQTNAVTFVMFIMLNRDLFTEWENDVKGIFEWTYQELGNHEYEKYGVTVMNEQTAYRVPGNSHSSRQASMELRYTLLSGDTTYKPNAFRTLNWATYTVDWDGKNRYIRDDIWLTDGYGDYIRHYLRAMGTFPELAPSHKNKLLSSSSVITDIEYSVDMITYQTFDTSSYEVLRLTKKPKEIISGNYKLVENQDIRNNCWTWTPLKTGGILRISHTDLNRISIIMK